jgi:hypothetical protein
MPRLIGKPSKAPMYVGFAFVVAVVGASILEYSGTLNLVPGFGDRQNRVEQPSGFSAERDPVRP